MKWAIGEIINWKNIDAVENLYHIHGTKDKLFPKRFINNYIKIDEGQHLMVVTKADEISSKLKKLII